MARKTERQREPRRVVLVGTYRGDQLKDWPGRYCWPLEVEGQRSKVEGQRSKVEGQRSKVESSTSGGANSPSAPPTFQPFNLSTFQRINELWLYRGTADERRYRAEFVGVKTREELIRDYGYPGDVSTQRRRDAEVTKEISHGDTETQSADGGAGNASTFQPFNLSTFQRGNAAKPHSSHYALFKTELLYRHKNDLPGEADAVIVRLKDFARSPKVRKQLREYLESPDRNDPDLAKLLPSIVTSVPPDRLKVCEAAHQMTFWDLPSMEIMKPAIPFPSQMNPTFTFIDLFAGMGGFRLAMEAQGGKCVFSSEWNKYAQKTYEANFGEIPYGDITKEETKAAIPECFDVLCAGFPCQPFSIAGVSKKKSLGRATGFKDKTQGTLFFDVADIISRHRPKAFFLENVKNLVSHDKGNTFRVIRETLEELEYSIHFRVMDGQEYVPQHRERIMIVGFDKRVFHGAECFDFPTSPGVKHRLADILEENPDAKYTLSDKLWNYLQNYAIKHQKKGNGFGFGMASLDGVSRTLSARYYKDGSEILIPQSDGRNPRRLTPHECARLMGYPDNYRIDVVSDVQAYRQCGNSVVVPLITAVAHNLIGAMMKGE